MKAKIIFALAIIFSTCTQSIARKKITVYGLAVFKSQANEMDDQEFKDEVYNVLDRNGFLVDSTNGGKSNTDYYITGWITKCNDRSSCHTFEYSIRKTNTKHETEYLNKNLYQTGLGNLRRNIQSSLLSMKSFQNETEWENYFMPGVSADLYMPRDVELGSFYGPSAEFVFYSRSKKRHSDRKGPSRIKCYGNIGILNADNTEQNDLFLTSTGINLSFEAQTNRNYLIPYFGLETGGLFSKNFSTLQFTPLVGCQFITTKKVIWSAQAGYLYSIKHFDQYSGYSFRTSLNLLLWK